jgi:hypothetical protein
VAELSSYLRQHIARYGEWSVDVEEAPPPLDECAYAADLIDLLRQEEQEETAGRAMTCPDTR